MAIQDDSHNTYPFFRMDKSQIKDIVYKYGTKVDYPSNFTVVNANNVMDSIYFIDQGRARYVSLSSEGEEKVFLILEEGSFFGLAPLFTEESVPMISVVTEVPAVLYKINRATAIQLFNSSEVFRNAVATYLGQLVISLMISVESLSFNSAQERLYDLLKFAADTECPLGNGWYKLKYKYTQEDMAKIIGTSRITVAKAMSQLHEDNLVRTINRHIQVKLE